LIAETSKVFGAIALFLAAIRIYAVLSYNVARRRHEPGIRIAPGTERSRITGLILEQTGLMIVAGLIAGVMPHNYMVSAQQAPAGLSLGMSMDLPAIARTICIRVANALNHSLHPCCSCC
jgi:ABC-type antimicrobial peptide transport system permease subunit